MRPSVRRLEITLLSNGFARSALSAETLQNALQHTDRKRPFVVYKHERSAAPRCDESCSCRLQLKIHAFLLLHVCRSCTLTNGASCCFVLSRLSEGPAFSVFVYMNLLPLAPFLSTFNWQCPPVVQQRNCMLAVFSWGVQIQYLSGRRSQWDLFQHRIIYYFFFWSVFHLFSFLRVSSFSNHPSPSVSCVYSNTPPTIQVLGMWESECPHCLLASRLVGWSQAWKRYLYNQKPAGWRRGWWMCCT